MCTKVKEYGSEFDWESTLPYISETEVPHFLKKRTAIRFRSGRDALKAVARTYKDSHDTVLLPALCCESMVTPFTMNGYRADFYKMNENCTVDVQDLENKLTDKTVLVYMPYFGVKPLEESMLESLRSKRVGARFVEDRTHNPLHGEYESVFTPDAVVISIRKWLSVPDGGLLFADDDVSEEFAVQDDFSETRKVAMEKKSQYLKTGNEEIKTQFRELLNKASEMLDVSAEPYAMTEQSEALLSKVNYEKILSQRKKNVKALAEGLRPLVYKGCLRFITDYPENSTLYFPVIVKNRDVLQKALAEKSVFCPVIWPVPEEAKGICSVSEYIADNMLAIPCDQRYSEEDMLEIVEIFNSVC